jgi:hypothetical protein
MSDLEGLQPGRGHGADSGVDHLGAGHFALSGSGVSEVHFGCDWLRDAPIGENPVMSYKR